jgi:hypothetical protein
MVTMGESLELKDRNRVLDVERLVPGITAEICSGLSQIIELLHPMRINSEKIRIGNRGDGGYVIAPLSKESDYILNLGVGTEISADMDLISRGYKIIAVDGTVENPLSSDFSGNYIFIQSNLGYDDSDSTISLSELYKRLDFKVFPELALIDIEGHEYDLLVNEWPLLSSSRQVVIEFHGLELLYDLRFQKIFLQILNSIMRTHAPIHVHGNNSGHLLNLSGGFFPTILEVTFLNRRTETLQNSHDYGPFPGPLDYPNLIDKADIDLSAFFGPDCSYLKIVRMLIDESLALRSKH